MTATIEGTAVKPINVKTPPVKSNYQRLRAPFSLRCGAFLIDYIVLVGIVALSTLVSRMLGGGAKTISGSSETIGIILAIVIAILNLGLMAGFTGRTVGKWATGLRIERTQAASFGIGRAFLRHFVGYPLSLITLGLGFLIAVLSTRGRTLHDLIAGTIVVREGVAKPTVRTRKP